MLLTLKEIGENFGQNLGIFQVQFLPKSQPSLRAVITKQLAEFVYPSHHHRTLHYRTRLIAV